MLHWKTTLQKVVRSGVRFLKRIMGTDCTGRGVAADFHSDPLRPKTPRGEDPVTGGARPSTCVCPQCTSRSDLTKAENVLRLTR